jgi:hypothetical protein
MNRVNRRLREVHGEAAYSDAEQPADGEARQARLGCALGHVFRGTLQLVWIARHDMDRCRWYQETEKFWPVRCIVCGLLVDREIP